MNYFVYILYSDGANKFYKGQTNNITDRVDRHNKGMEISTKHDAPWQLVWTVEQPTRSAAILLEKKVKNLSRERLIRFMLKYSVGFANQFIKARIELLTN